jgi:hypothetical protein
MAWALIIGPVPAAALAGERHLDGVGRGRDLVITDPGGYRVAAERIDLDLDRFDERITAAGKTGTRMARKLLSEAVQARARSGGSALGGMSARLSEQECHELVQLARVRCPGRVQDDGEGPRCCAPRRLAGRPADRADQDGA